jgi:hypothetical protein
VEAGIRKALSSLIPPATLTEQRPTADSGTTVFEMSPNSDGTWMQTILYEFAFDNGTNDIRPGVKFGADGNL